MKLPVGYVPGVGVHKPTAYGGFGEKLLKQLGWNDGEGLGAQGTGITSALKVLKKEDNIGVGASQSIRQKNSGWWEDAYNTAARVIARGGASSSDSDSDSETAFDDDDIERSTSAVNRDGTRASGTADELRIAQELAKDPWGRFGGRDGKLARIRRQEAAALAALTGASAAEPALRAKRKLESSAAAEPVSTPSKKARRQASTLQPKAEVSAEPQKRKKKQKAPKEPQQASEEPLEGKTAGKKREQADEAAPVSASKSQKGRKKASKGVEVSKVSDSGPQASGLSIENQSKPASMAGVVVEIKGPADAPASLLKPTQRHGWWGASKFISSGCLEGLDHTKELVAKERQTFDEDTQADLYNQAQNTKTAGKKGLGRVAGSGKPVGSDWKGTRVTFDDAAQEQLVEDSISNEASTSVAEVTIKWKKLAKQALLQDPKGKMKISQLLKRISELASSKQQSVLSKISDAETMLAAKVNSSSLFIVKGSIVKLAQS